MTTYPGRIWRSRRQGYYPLLVSGLGFLEYLSPEDCALIADALDVSRNPHEDETDVRQLRTLQLAARFRQGAEGGER